MCLHHRARSTDSHNTSPFHVGFIEPGSDLQRCAVLVMSLFTVLDVDNAIEQPIGTLQPFQRQLQAGGSQPVRRQPDRIDASAECPSVETDPCP